MATINLSIVSAVKTIYSGEADCIFAPASMGEVGIYPKHCTFFKHSKSRRVKNSCQRRTKIYICVRWCYRSTTRFCNCAFR